MSLRDIHDFEPTTRRAHSRNERGYFGVVCYRPKKGINVGGLWRSAHIFGASFLATVGQRYRAEPADVTKAPRHIPLWSFEDWDSFWQYIPYDCQPVVVEIAERAKWLSDFSHPPRAVYILGPEDGSVPNEIITKAYAVVRLPGRYCLNLATTGSIVLYDRFVKTHPRL